MKDIRISIRLSEQEHETLKIIAIKKKQSIQQLMLEYISNLINRETNPNEEH